MEWFPNSTDAVLSGQGLSEAFARLGRCGAFDFRLKPAGEVAAASCRAADRVGAGQCCSLQSRNPARVALRNTPATRPFSVGGSVRQGSACCADLVLHPANGKRNSKVLCEPGNSLHSGLDRLAPTPQSGRG